MWRILWLYQQLRAGNHGNCTVWAARLSVDTKTVFRDLEFLKYRLGFEFEFDARVNAYVVKPDQPCIFCGGDE